MIDNINIPDYELDKSIYRIVPFDRFMETLEKRTNTFVRPHLWDDPFENILTFPSLVKKTNNHYMEHYFVYAQCWSFSGENDLLWRVYSPNSDSVRIKSTPRKLLESLKNSKVINQILNTPNPIYIDEALSIDEEIDGFIGEVKYLPYDKMKTYLAERIYKTSLHSFFETLLIKRKAFQNEEEFRIGIRHLWGIDYFELELSNDVFKYDVNVNSLIDEVVFDPRVSDYKFKSFKEQIQKQGFGNPISKSSLYDMPKLDEIIK